MLMLTLGRDRCSKNCVAIVPNFSYTENNVYTKLQQVGGDEEVYLRPCKSGEYVISTMLPLYEHSKITKVKMN